MSSISVGPEPPELALPKEHGETIRSAFNYADSLRQLKRFEEAKTLMRKMIPVARRVLGEEHSVTLTMKAIYADALYMDPGATLDDLREAVTTQEEAEQIARRVLGRAHPDTTGIEASLRKARATLAARETPSPPGSEAPPKNAVND